MNEEPKHWYFKFRVFRAPIIMSGDKYYEDLHNLHRQIEELASIDGGLAQPCHCSEPCKCEEQRKFWQSERDGLAANIRTALML